MYKNIYQTAVIHPPSFRNEIHWKPSVHLPFIPLPDPRGFHCPDWAVSLPMHVFQQVQSCTLKAGTGLHHTMCWGLFI